MLTVDYTSSKRTVHPSDFENKHFPLNLCFVSRHFQTGKAQTKTETIVEDTGWKGSSNKRLSLELLGCTVRLKEV